MTDPPIVGLPPLDDWIKGASGTWDWWHRGELIVTAEQFVEAFRLDDMTFDERRRKVAAIMELPSAQRGMPADVRAGLERRGLL